MEKSSLLGKLGNILLSAVVIVSVCWTFFSLIMLVKQKVFTPSHPELQTQVTVTLPKLSPPLVYQNLPGIQPYLDYMLSDTVQLGNEQPIRLAVVYQSDSTCYVELTFVDECSCSEEKLDRYSITRTVIDPLTGLTLTQLGESSLSAERLTRYFGGLTQIRRSQ